MLGPFERIIAARVPGTTFLVLGVILLAFFVTVHSIYWHGGGGAGEPLGCLAGIAVWAGRFAAPAVVSLFAVSPRLDLWKIVGGSTPPLALAIGLWLRDRRRS